MSMVDIVDGEAMPARIIRTVRWSAFFLRVIIMKRFALIAFVAVATAGVLAGAGVAWADPPGGFPNAKGFDLIPDLHGKPQGEEPHGGGPHGGQAEGAHFQDKDRLAVRNYYAELERNGQCPPG